MKKSINLLTIASILLLVTFASGQDITSGESVFTKRIIIRKPISTIPRATEKQVATSKRKTSKSVTKSKRESKPTTNVKNRETYEIVDTSNAVITGGELIEMPSPTYPPMAAQTGVTGKVVIAVTIDEAGNVINAIAVSGPQILIPVSVEVAKLAKFNPTLVNGKPAMATGHLTYNFAK